MIATASPRPETPRASDPSSRHRTMPSASTPSPTRGSLAGKRAAVIVLSDYPGDARVRRASEALAGEGMTVDLICRKRHPTDAVRDQFNGVNILRLPFENPRRGKVAYFLHYLGFLMAAGTILTLRCFTRRYHLVHVHNMPDILVFSALLPRLLGAKVILDLHDPMPELMMTIYELDRDSRAVRLLKFLEKLSVGFASAVITVNKTCHKIFASRSCKFEKVTVVLNTTDEKVFALRPPQVRLNPSPDQPFVIMYHGALVERHGLALAVEAVRRVREKVPNVELHIYGDKTPYLEKVLATIQEQKLEHFCRYLGPKTLEEIVRAIDACDLGVIPNMRSIFTELNTPTRIFEFLARGKPVVTPAAPGVLEYFGEEHLLLFPLGDAERLAERIAFAVQHPREVQAIVTRGQQVCAEHRWAEERRGMIAMIQRLLRVSPAAANPEASGA